MADSARHQVSETSVFIPYRSALIIGKFLFAIRYILLKQEPKVRPLSVHRSIQSSIVFHGEHYRPFPPTGKRCYSVVLCASGMCVMTLKTLSLRFCTESETLAHTRMQIVKQKVLTFLKHPVSKSSLLPWWNFTQLT